MRLATDFVEAVGTGHHVSFCQAYNGFTPVNEGLLWTSQVIAYMSQTGHPAAGGAAQWSTDLVHGRHS